jgi:hypothetical protein
MKRMGGWLSAKTPLQSSSSTRSLTALDEPHACKIRLHVIETAQMATADPNQCEKPLQQQPIF